MAMVKPSVRRRRWHRQEEAKVGPTDGGAEQAAADTGFDSDYWLAHCEGYRVDSGDGCVGFVEEIRLGAGSTDRLLVVRAGRLGRRLLLVPAGEVAFIVPRAEQLWLRSTAILATEAAA